MNEGPVTPGAVAAPGVGPWGSQKLYSRRNSSVEEISKEAVHLLEFDQEGVVSMR
jgi:hypothetical protein